MPRVDWGPAHAYDYHRWVPQTSDHDSGVPVVVGDTRPQDDNLPPGVSGEDGLLLRIFKDRRVAFLFVGGLNTAIGTMWFLLFDWWLGAKWNGYGHYPALVITYVFSILCAFVLYRKIVFKVHGNLWRDLGRFSTVYISAFAVNLVLLWVMIHVFHWHPFLSQCLITFITTIFSWVGHNRYSFRRPDAESDVTESADSSESSSSASSTISTPHPTPVEATVRPQEK